jgi:hypothetical protein
LAQWELTVRRKPLGDPAEVHACLVHALAALPEPWRLKDPPRGGPKDPTATTTVRGPLGNGIVATATYRLRSDWHPDNADYDDVFVFAFDPAKVPLAPIGEVVLATLVPALEAYRAGVADLAFLAREAPLLAEKKRHFGVDLDGRHGIHRLSPQSYYDAHLIDEELGVTPAQFAQRARGWVREFHHGVLVAMPLAPGRRGEFESSDEALRALASVG